MTKRVVLTYEVALGSSYRLRLANGAKTRLGRKPGRGLGAWALALTLGVLLGTGGCSRVAPDFPAVRCPRTDWPTVTSPDQSLSSRIILCGWSPAGQGTTMTQNEGQKAILSQDLVSIVAGVEIESRSDTPQEVQLAIISPIGPSDDMLFEKLRGRQLPGTVITVAPRTKRVVYVQSISERLDKIADVEFVLQVGPMRVPLPPVPPHDELFRPGSCAHTLAVVVQSARWKLVPAGTNVTGADGREAAVKFPLAMVELFLVVTNPGPYPVAFYPENLRVTEAARKAIDFFYIPDMGTKHPLIDAGRSLPVNLVSPTFLQDDIPPAAEISLSYSGRKLGDLPPFPQASAGAK